MVKKWPKHDIWTSHDLDLDTAKIQFSSYCHHSRPHSPEISLSMGTNSKNGSTFNSLLRLKSGTSNHDIWISHGLDLDTAKIQFSSYSRHSRPPFPWNLTQYGHKIQEWVYLQLYVMVKKWHKHDILNSHDLHLDAAKTQFLHTFVILDPFPLKSHSVWAQNPRMGLPSTFYHG
jgi:hypothetical protein